MDSNTPPKWGAAGGFQYQVTPWFDVIRWSWSWFSWLTKSLISFSAPTKFVPLSLSIFVGHPLLAAIRTKALRNAPVSNEVAISKWQQCVCKHKNKQVTVGTRSSTPLNGKVWSSKVNWTVSERFCCHLETDLWQWSHLLLDWLDSKMPCTFTTLPVHPYDLLMDMDN